jgi:hypothetical protein
LLAASAVREARVGTTEGGGGTSAVVERRRKETAGIAVGGKGKGEGDECMRLVFQNLGL